MSLGSRNGCYTIHIHLFGGNQSTNFLALQSILLELRCLHLSTKLVLVWDVFSYVNQRSMRLSPAEVNIYSPVPAKSTWLIDKLGIPSISITWFARRPINSWTGRGKQSMQPIIEPPDFLLTFIMPLELVVWNKIITSVCLHIIYLIEYIMMYLSMVKIGLSSKLIDNLAYKSQHSRICGVCIDFENERTVIGFLLEDLIYITSR